MNLKLEDIDDYYIDTVLLNSLFACVHKYPTDSALHDHAYKTAYTLNLLYDFYKKTKESGNN